MRLNRNASECMATDILKRHGFKLTNPDESLVTSQVWSRDGKNYQFTGWENTPKTNFMAANPNYISVEEIN